VVEEKKSACPRKFRCAPQIRRPSLPSTWVSKKLCGKKRAAVAESPVVRDKQSTARQQTEFWPVSKLCPRKSRQKPPPRCRPKRKRTPLSVSKAKIRDRLLMFVRFNPGVNLCGNKPKNSTNERSLIALATNIINDRSNAVPAYLGADEVRRQTLYLKY